MMLPRPVSSNSAVFRLSSSFWSVSKTVGRSSGLNCLLKVTGVFPMVKFVRSASQTKLAICAASPHCDTIFVSWVWEASCSASGSCHCKTRIITVNGQDHVAGSVCFLALGFIATQHQLSLSRPPSVSNQFAVKNHSFRNRHRFADCRRKQTHSMGDRQVPTLRPSRRLHNAAFTQRHSGGRL